MSNLLKVFVLSFFIVFLSTTAFACSYEPDEDPQLVWSSPGYDTVYVFTSERLLFGAYYSDMDVSIDGMGFHSYYWPDESVYEQKWSITGDASFTGGTTTLNITGSKACNIPVFIGATFTSGTITVKVKLYDYGSPTHPTDSDGEPAVTRTYTIYYTDKCPTTMTCIAPTNPTAWYSGNATYNYEFGPDKPTTPDYPLRAIQEVFGGISSNLDKDVHITAYGRSVNPSWSNTAWANNYFGTNPTLGTNGRNCTFVIQGADGDFIDDTHSGFVNTDDYAYLVAPTCPSELYFDLPQTYTCTGATTALAKTYTIRRRHDAGDDYYSSQVHIRKQ